MSAFPFASRREALRPFPENCDSVLITNMTNIRYLTGFTGSAAMLFFTPDDCHLVVDGRYTEQAAEETDCRLTKRDRPLQEVLAEYMEGGRRCLVESGHLTIEGLRRLSAAAKDDVPEFVPIGGFVERLRLIKSPDEIEKLRAATALLEDLMEKTIRSLRPDRSELEVGVEFENRVRLATGRRLPFDPIVASGPRSSLPHGVASARRMKKDEFVKLDLGLELDGYVADMTRTVVLGKADSRMREIHSSVERARDAAAREIRMGMTGEEAHSIALRVLAEDGFGDLFTHGLGHGVGLEVHEAPRLGLTSDDRLEAGMVFTIEPGAYIPGWGGVRIEDCVVLRAEGVEVFNSRPRGLEEI